MKKTLAVIISILLIATNVYAREAKRKIGYVYLYKVIAEYDKTKKTEEALKSDLSSRDTMVNGLREELKTAQSRLLNIQYEAVESKKVFDNTIKSKDQAIAELIEKIQK